MTALLLALVVTQRDVVTQRGAVIDLAERAVKAEGLEWNRSEIEAMADICWRESRYKPYCQNPKSSAYGLYQFLDSTWQYYGIGKTSDPYLQTVAFTRYVSDRYGTPKDALDFWRTNKWY